MIDGLCKQANIENNDHTVYSLEDVMYDLSLLKKTVQTKISFLENQVYGVSLLSNRLLLSNSVHRLQLKA